MVNRPALVTSILAPTKLDPTALMLSACPVKSNTPVRFRSPVNVVDTVPASWVKLTASKMLDANTVPAVVTVTAPRSTVLPTAPVKVMLPAPAVNPRVCAPADVPFSVLLNRMSSPDPKPVVMVMPEASVTPVAKENPSLVLTKLPPKLFDPAPFCINSLPTVRLAPTAVVKRPALATDIVVPTLLPTPLIVRALPVNANAPLRSNKPLNNVVPVPATCVKLVALTAPLKVAPPDCVIVKADKGVVAPIVLPKVI